LVVFGGLIMSCIRMKPFLIQMSDDITQLT
jgi:hypothetical protein